MTMARMDVLASDRSLIVDVFDDDDDDLPTTVFRRDGAFESGVVRAAAREHRWALPSSDTASPEEFSRAIIERIIRELPPLAPSTEADRSPTVPPPPPAKKPRLPTTTLPTTNVFLTKPRQSDPTPPWDAAPDEHTRRTTLPRKRRSLLPLFAFAVAAAIGVGLWRDPAARASVLADLDHAASRVSAFLGASH